MKKIGYNIAYSFVCVVVGAIGMSFTLKADIGVGSINAFSATASELTGIKVGTIVMLFNMACVLVQLAIQKKDFHWRQWLQLGVSFVIGEVVNVMIYTLLAQVNLTTYIGRLLLFLSGTLLSCVSIAAVIRLNLVVFPVEAACMVVSKKYNWQFKHVRQAVDGIIILLALIMTVVAQTQWTIREGTILNFLLLAPITQFFLHKMEKAHLFENVRIR